MGIIKRFFIISLAFLMLSTYYPTLSADAQSSYGEGSLLKVKGNSAVYYIGPDGQKYVFPEGKTYNSWYDNFSKVKEVSTAELDKYPDGGVMPIKGGTKLITHSNTSKVYAVEPGGVLRHIPSEKVAKELFGDDWYEKVVDVLPGFFSSTYKVGEELSDTLPNGYLVTYGSKYYYIENGKKRLMTKEVLKLNNLKESDAIRVKNLSRYKDDNSISKKINSLTNFVPPIKELDEDKVVVCHNSNNLRISKNALKAHLAIGDTLGTCKLDNTNAGAKSTEDVNPDDWCSTLLGLFNSSSLGYSSSNPHSLLDLNNDGVVNLSDSSMAVELYNSGNNTACLGYIEENYIASNYQNLDWCNSLVQGISDNIGSTNPFGPFDLNNDSKINLSDISVVATYVYEADQAQCYSEYVPLLPSMTSDVMLDNDSDNDGYNSLTSGGADCNDNSASINPGATEICGDSIDQDCSGADLACIVSTNTNLIQNSWDFSSAYWDGDLVNYPRSHFVFTSGQADPFGTNKAFKIASNFAFGWQQRDSTPSLILNYDTVTASVYVKYGTATNLIFGITQTDVSYTVGEFEQTFVFDNNGVPTWSSSNSHPQDGHTVTSVGNGWYRLSVTYNLASRGIKGHPFSARLTPAGTSATIGAYTYVTGFQLESGNSATTYVEQPSGNTPPPVADTTAPSTPTNLSASANGTQISLNWSASTDNIAVSQYLIERSVSANSGFSQIANSATKSYTDSGLNAGTTYYYRIKAQDTSSNNSAYSSTANATTGTISTPPPSSGSPVVDSLSDNTLTDGQSLTITGSGFGTKVSVGGIVGPPVLWDNFEDGTNGQLVQPSASKWDRVRSDNTSGPRYYSGAIDGSMGVRTGSGIVDGVTAGNTRSLIEDDEFRNLYLDYYIRAVKGDGLKQRSNKQVMIWSANAGISEDGPNTAFWQITQGGEEPPFAFSEYSCSNEPFSIVYGNGWGVDEFTTARHVQIEYRRPSIMGVDNGHLRMWYDGVLVSEDSSFGSYSCNPDTNYLDNLYIGHYQDVDSAVEPQWKWISCPGDARCDQCPAGASGCSVDNPDWLPARQDEFFYDNIYIDKSIARVEIGNASTYAASTRREVQIPSSWGNSIQITVNKGGFSSGQAAYLYVMDSSGRVNTNGYPITFN